VVSQAVITWLACGQLVTALFGPMGWVLSMTGRHLLELAILAAGLVLATLLCALAIPALGQIGAAVATFTAIAFTNGARMLWVRRTLRALPFDWKVLMLVAAGLALALGSRWLVGRSGLDTYWSTAGGISMFVGCYAALCWRYLRGLHKEVKANATG
jgi:O-antigen/teichoic acid export membrane protein